MGPLGLVHSVVWVHRPGKQGPSSAGAVTAHSSTWLWSLSGWVTLVGHWLHDSNPDDHMWTLSSLCLALRLQPRYARVTVVTDPTEFPLKPRTEQVHFHLYQVCLYLTGPVTQTPLFCWGWRRQAFVCVVLVVECQVVYLCLNSKSSAIPS